MSDSPDKKDFEKEKFDTIFERKTSPTITRKRKIPTGLIRKSFMRQKGKESVSTSAKPRPEKGIYFGKKPENRGFKTRVTFLESKGKHASTHR